MRTVSVEIEFDYPERTSDLAESVEEALRDIGVEPVAASDTVLRFELEGTPRSASYRDIGECFTGALIRGTIGLAAADLSEVRAPIAGDLPTLDAIFSDECASEPSGAPFDDAFDAALNGAMAAVFGPASVPHLIEVFSPDPFSGRSSFWSDIDWAKERAAVDAYRSLDYDTIPMSRQFEFLDAVLWSIEGPYRPGGVSVDQAAHFEALRAVFLDYSATDFGFSGDDDFRAWRQWLDDLRAEHAGQATRDGSGAIVAAGALAVADLRVGDCFDHWPGSPVGPSRTHSVPVVPCAEPHEREVYLAFEAPPGGFPGVDALLDMARGRCRDAFEDYVGVDPANSELSHLWMIPPSESWDQGDRTIYCILSGSGPSLVGSMRGTGR